MRDAAIRFFALLALYSTLSFAASGNATAFSFGGAEPEGVCQAGTVANYIGTSCSLPPAVYHWTSYQCSSTPQSICDRLGANGANIHMRRDPNGANTLLVGGTALWNVTAGQSVDVIIRGTVSGATGNLTWPHFHEGRAVTGDGVEENITTVECGSNCRSGNGVSATICRGDSPDEMCVEQHRIGPYRRYRAEFGEAGADRPYPMTIEVKLNGGTHGSASIRSLGLHVSAFGQGRGRGN